MIHSITSQLSRTYISLRTNTSIFDRVRKINKWALLLEQASVRHFSQTFRIKLSTRASRINYFVESTLDPFCSEIILQQRCHSFGTIKNTSWCLIKAIGTNWNLSSLENCTFNTNLNRYRISYEYYHKLKSKCNSKSYLLVISFVQMISIDFLKTAFEIYGTLEKIAIFHDDFNNTKFAHVSFKKNRPAYCALLDIKQQKDNNIVLIRPADAHLQPDNPVDPSTSPFYNMPDDCFLTIFDYCDFHTLAKLSTVCKKLSELLRTRVFAKIPKFNSVATNDTEVADGLLTVSRLVQCINPPNFHLKISRDLLSSVEWPAMSVDMKSSKSEVSVEMDFFKPEWLNRLDKIEKRIKSIHIHRSVYDSATFDQATVALPFPAATKLTISGFSCNADIPDLSKVVTSLPKLETIFLRNGSIMWEHIVNYCRDASSLQQIIFENCLFDSEIGKERILQIVNANVISGKTEFPLCLLFDRIEHLKTKTSAAAEKFCGCISCPSHPSFRTQFAPQLTKFICGCPMNKCSVCGRNKCVVSAANMSFNSKEESSYDEIMQVLLWCIK